MQIVIYMHEEICKLKNSSLKREENREQGSDFEMVRCYFANLQNITMSELNSATKSIKACVAWINFSCYESMFCNLLSRGVEIEIIVNDDDNNRKYINTIQQLNALGAKIKLFRASGIMHHKFCIIDNCRCMFGSFNWSYNADTRNIEDLNVTDDILAVNNYRLEFEAIWNLTKEDLRILRKPQLCKSCKRPILNVLFMQQDGYYNTKVEVMQICDCKQDIVVTENFDISFYNNYSELCHYFEDQLIEAQQNNDVVTYNEITSQQDFSIANYLTLVRENRMGCPIIHAVGIKAWRWITKDEGEYYYKMIWKERNTSSYIKDEYDILI